LEDYRPVKQRLNEFRQHHPDWSIDTRFYPELPVKGEHVLARTWIRDSDGSLIAAAHAFEIVAKPFDVEKAETSSWGRALVAAGYTDSLELSQEELERSEGVQKPEKGPYRDPGPATVEGAQKQQLTVHPDPAPLSFLDMLRLNKPKSTAPKGIWYDHLTALVAAAAHDGIKVDWTGMAGGKHADKLTSTELKILIDDLELEMLGGGV